MDWLQLRKLGNNFFQDLFSLCKLQPEILINIVKYPLIVKMYNQCIFYNIKNFWLKLTHCENKSWKKLCPSFLNCKLSAILQHFFHKILGRIFFPQLVGAGIFLFRIPLQDFFSKLPPPPIKS